MRFFKYQATGNDFILIENPKERDWSALAKSLCQPHFGIGADGLIVIKQGRVLEIRLFNPDGSEAEISGNGLRCVAKLAYDRKWVQGDKVKIKTKAGIREALLLIDKGEVKKVKVNMGRARFKPRDIPVNLNLPAPILDYPLQIGERELPLSFVSLGNPHAVLFIQEPVESFPLQEIGPRIENHPLFPQRINLEVARIISPNFIEARTWERGTKETLSCGSGACAIASIAHTKNLTHYQVNIKLKGGEVRVEVGGEIWLEGEVERVFWGEVEG